MAGIRRLTFISVLTLVLVASSLPVGLAYTTTVTDTAVVECIFLDNTEEIVSGDSDPHRYEFVTTEQTGGDFTDLIVIRDTGESFLGEDFDMSFEPKGDNFYLKITAPPGNNSRHSVTINVTTLEKDPVTGQDVTATTAVTVQSTSAGSTFYIFMKGGQVGHGNAAPSTDNGSQWLGKDVVDNISIQGHKNNTNAPPVQIEVVYHDFS